MNDRVELAQLFRDKGFKTGAEIGVSLGKYSRQLLESIPGLRLFSIDNWEGKYTNNETEARNKLKDFAGSIIIKGDSVEVSKGFDDGSLDFVYIDGDHTQWGVRRDLEAWTPKVRKGGIVSGHDWQLPSVREVLEPLKDKIIIINPNQRYPSWYFIND